jgi:hypothetical protein
VEGLTLTDRGGGKLSEVALFSLEPNRERSRLGLGAITMSDLGPLPKTCRSDKLEWLSVRALHGALPPELFQLRPETYDKGVDLFLEVKADGYFTNFRAQIQLKGTHKASLNRDGSFSLPVKTSNLNYLLNGGTSLYIVWIAPRNELRFVWAWDEYRRLMQENRHWREQLSVTLYFTQSIDSETLPRIHSRILKEGRNLREAKEKECQPTRAEYAEYGDQMYEAVVEGT